MAWLLGAGVGFVLGGPLGAVIGGSLQSIMSRSSRIPLDGNSPAANGEQIFISNLVAIMAKISMADGSISSQERKTIHDFFARALRYQGQDLQFIDAIINETERVNPDLTQICREFDRFAQKEQRLVLLDLVYQVATTDHVITREENEAIRQVVSALGLNQEEHEHIRSRHSAARRHDHYTVLGVDSTVSNDELKKSYRQLASQYHPDKVSHLGPELVAFSTNKIKSINEAYAAVRKERGF
ncbi:MAG TPA: TerB family tellurite resistance protein [Nitrospiria bacterium]|nr:TerB family tellurite resistance protein [Nitrospiria bacterium]